MATVRGLASAVTIYRYRATLERDGRGCAAGVVAASTNVMAIDAMAAMATAGSTEAPSSSATARPGTTVFQITLHDRIGRSASW